MVRPAGRDRPADGLPGRRTQMTTTGGTERTRGRPSVLSMIQPNNPPPLRSGLVQHPAQPPRRGATDMLEATYGAAVGFSDALGPGRRTPGRPPGRCYARDSAHALDAFQHLRFGGRKAQPPGAVVAPVASGRGPGSAAPGQAPDRTRRSKWTKTNGNVIARAW
jgi:hypothetical protein